MPFIAVAMLLLGVAACGNSEPDSATPSPTPSPTSTQSATNQAASPIEAIADISFITVATDAPSRFGDFGDIDPFGNVTGFDPDVMARLAAAGGFVGRGRVRARLDRVLPRSLEAVDGR